MTHSSRRDFLKLTANALFGLAGLLGLSGLVRFLGYQSDPAPPTEFDLGTAADFPPGSSPIFRTDIPAVIYNTEGIFTAYSLTCTHLGCMVETDGQGFTCPCHGSRFGADGAVLQGPARLPLRPLRVEVTADGILRAFTQDQPDI
ncbi:MAG: hypothetical protein Fur0043_18810 [Anaerolineales bacterium]